MGDCRTFMEIPPLIHWEDGSTCINPDYNAVTKFHLSAKAIQDPTLGGSPSALVDNVLLNAGERKNFFLRVDREENGMGHFLINELFMFTNPSSAPAITATIKDQQGDRVFMNTDVYRNHLFSTAHLSRCLPCPIMLFPNQQLVIEVENHEAVPVYVRIAARGKRFMPYHDMGLAYEMEECWNRIPVIPYWITIDSLGVIVPAAVGTTPGASQVQMTVPGGGWFDLKYPTADVEVAGPGNFSDGANVFVSVSEGRSGKRSQNLPIPISLYAPASLNVAGFPGGIFRSVEAGHCPPPSQIYRANTRITHNLENHNAQPTRVRLTYAGCYYFVDRCPSNEDLNAVRSGLYENPMVLEPDWECFPPPVPEGAFPQEPLEGLGSSPQGEWERI